MTIVSQVFDHVIGVDTHAKTHTLVVLDSHGAKQAGDTFPTSPAGLKRAHAWMLRHARLSYILGIVVLATIITLVIAALFH